MKNKEAICIFLIAFLTVSVSAKTKNDLVKVFISKEYLEEDSSSSLFWTPPEKPIWGNKLVYSQLKKLKDPFYIAKKEESSDLTLIPKNIEYEKIKVGDIEYYKDRNGWTGKIKYQETFVVEILMIDSYGNCFNKISEKFSGNGYNHSGSKWSAKMEVEYRFYRICLNNILKESHLYAIFEPPLGKNRATSPLSRATLSI